MPESVFESILQATRNEILRVCLPELPDDHCRIIKNYRTLAPVELPGLPGVVIFPTGVETITPVTNASDDIGYPVAVGMLADDRNDDGDGDTQSQELNRDRHLYWRERIRDHFGGQRLTGVPTVWDCRVEPAVIVDPSEHANNLWRGGLVLRFVSRERRGVNVANVGG